MATKRQELGSFGEQRVVADCFCPRCKRAKTLKRLPNNFKCADVVCDFCGYLAQVKTSTTKNVSEIPPFLMGAAWDPQRERMQAGIYFPLFLVLVTSDLKTYAIHYLAADLQKPEMFIPRAPLAASARRAGWTGFRYDLRSVHKAFVRVPDPN